MTHVCLLSACGLACQVAVVATLILRANWSSVPSRSGKKREDASIHTRRLPLASKLLHITQPAKRNTFMNEHMSSEAIPGNPVVAESYETAPAERQCRVLKFVPRPHDGKPLVSRKGSAAKIIPFRKAVS